MVTAPQNYLTENDISVALKMMDLTWFSPGNPELCIIRSHLLSRFSLLLQDKGNSIPSSAPRGRKKENKSVPLTSCWGVNGISVEKFITSIIYFCFVWGFYHFFGLAAKLKNILHTQICKLQVTDSHIISCLLTSSWIFSNVMWLILVNNGVLVISL